MIKNGDNVILKFSTIWDGELCRDNGKAYIYPSMERAEQFYHPGCEVLVEYTPVRHARWEDAGKNIHGQNLTRCSHCNGTSIEGGLFCRNCGAQMDGGKHE